MKTCDELLSAVSIHRPESGSAYVVLAEIAQPWRDQFQEALRSSACPLVEGVGHWAHEHDWQVWVRDEWYHRPGPSKEAELTTTPQPPG